MTQKMVKKMKKIRIKKDGKKGRLWKALKIAGIGLVLTFAYFYIGLSSKPQEMEWGITFSKNYAESLGLDWIETYLALLDDLKVDNLRLSVYWNQIEKQDDVYDFSWLDWQIEEASKRNAKILLAVGRRLPRWPECHVPEWAQNSESRIQNTELLEYTEVVINRYKDNPNIWAWQVENEFFLRGFGECLKADKKLFDSELKLVRSLDSRPIVLTDSGELGGWIGSMRRGDIFGTTMYRIVYNPMWGEIEYPLSPIFYKRKFLLLKPFGRAKDIINVELQAEPWLPLKFSAAQFEKNIQYARDSGIGPAYLWGGEWWYYMKENQGKDELWNIARSLWQ